jgi:hypothetical protein
MNPPSGKFLSGTFRSDDRPNATLSGLKRVSPLIHKHIHFQGRYSFALAESVARGDLRPLRDPYEQDE